MGLCQNKSMMQLINLASLAILSFKGTQALSPRQGNRTVGEESECYGHAEAESFLYDTYKRIYRPGRLVVCTGSIVLSILKKKNLKKKSSGDLLVGSLTGSWLGCIP